MPIPTPHLSMRNKDDIAKTVLMPGDPLRAKLFVEKYLTDYKQINSVRNMFGYTGYYKGKKVTVMGSGMGQPSIGIYSYELFKFYDVDTIIRVGSAGAYTQDLNVYDVILATEAYSESTYAEVAYGYEDHVQPASKQLVDKINAAANRLGYNLINGRVHSSDVFYRNHGDVFKDVVEKYDTLCVEMESYALYANAKFLHKNAACILTISDSLVKDQVTTSEERQSKFLKMMEIALEAAE